MTQRVLSTRQTFNDRPFEGSGGTSLYAELGDGPVQYRNLRILGASRRRRRRIRIKGQGGNHDLAAASVLKTARRASVSDPTESIDFALPASWIPGAGTQDVTFDVRRFADDVEHEIDNFRTRTVTIDTAGDEDSRILGTATLLDQQQRDGGVVRLRIAWNPSRDGVQPTVFTAVRTAGPTSPADAAVTVDQGTRLIEIDTPALSDSAPYTYKIQASAGAVTADVLTGITVTADATGPPAPVNGLTEAV